MPVCFRHPDRETYIRCTRCERSICPDCMISASVGFQCPECVAEGKASAPVIKTRLGAKAPTRPYVTFAIIALCVAVFAYQSLGGDKVDNAFAMSPVDIAANNEYYRLVTSMFMHVNLLHIGMNMLVLWLLGPQLEFMLGHVRYAVLYLVAGIGGSVVSFWLSSPYEINGQFYLPSSSVGASGAIFGLMGAYLVVGRALKADVTQALGLIVINLVLGFVIPGTDWRAHLGGLVTGILVAIPMAYAPKRGRTAIQVGAVVVVLALLAGAVVLRDQALTAQMIRDGINLSAVGA